MSAWMCSAYHISVLAAYAVKNVEKVYHGSKLVPLMDVQTVGSILMAQNARSVNERYSERKVYPFTYDQRVKAGAEGHSAMEVIKSAHCYEYQACETDDWKRTVAHTIILHILSAASVGLPGWEDAPWGLDGPTTKTPARKLGSRLW